MSQLFDKFTEPKVKPVPSIEKYVPSDDEKRNHATKAAELLDYLRLRDWVTTSELAAINHRFSACIHSLRNDGYVFESRRQDGGQFEWRYAGKCDLVHVTDEWKQAYYSSDHWRRVRAARLILDAYRCVICHADGPLEVHHWWYELFAEQSQDLTTVCRSCHERIHERLSISFPKSVSREVFGRLEGVSQ